MPKLRKQQPVPPPVPTVPLSEKVSLSVVEVSALTGLGQTTIREEISTGRLRAARFGRALLVTRTEVEAWMARETEKSVVTPVVPPRETQLLRAIADARWGLAVCKQTGAKLQQLVLAKEA